MAPDAINENISFADAKVKTLCVANWDTDGDGELSMNEAAAVTDLGSVFSRNASLTSFDELQFFTGLTSIAVDAFNGCTGLTSVVIPESVTRLESYSFYNCLSLTSITIPSDVSYIGEYVFSKCSSLNYIHVNDDNTTYNDGNGSNCIIKRNTKTLVAGCKYTVIPSNVEVIQNGAFEKNFGLTTLTIPSSVKSIGDYAFKDCYNLTSVNILSSSMTLGVESFLNCSSLTSVYFHMKTPPAYATDSFNGISSSCTLTVPQGTSNSYIAAGWTASIFKGGLKEMVQNISFMDSNVKSLCVANWDTNGDGELSYQEASLVSSLGSVFKGNTDIAFFNELQYFTGLTSIDNDAFRNCSNLSSVQIPSTVYLIGAYAFYSCSNLTSIYIPESVETIQGYTFCGCSMLQSITMPDKIISYTGLSAFDNINNIATVHISNLETWLRTDFTNGNNPLRSGGRLYINGQELKNLVIPDNISSLQNGAFEGCSSLETVTLNKSIKTIPNAAFANCHSLRSFNMTANLKNIEVNAFTGCRNISFVIPENVSYIGPSGLRCERVQNNNIIVKALTPPSISSDTFLNQNGYIFVPSSSLAAYKSASDWIALSNQIMPLDLENLILSENAELAQWTNTSSDTFQYNTWSYENDASGMRTPFIEVWRGTGNNLSNTTISHQTLTDLAPGSYTVQIQARAFNEGNTSVYPSGITFYANDASVKLEDVGKQTIYNNESTELYSLLSLTASVTSDGKLDIGFRVENAICDWISFKNLLITKSEDTQQNIIEFADANVKALCVANWDTDGDGELSMNEAAAVTDLGSVFIRKASLTSFDELQYFTGLTSIGSAFSYCRGLTSVTIPSSVTSIGSSAFTGCRGLTSVTIPSNVTSIGRCAFNGCSGLTSIMVDSSNQYYNDENGSNCIIETATNTLVAGCKNTVIPEGVTSIGYAAFRNCSSLTSVTIPEGVTSIKNYAFEGCSGLTSVTIPSSVTSIEGNAFYGCIGLTSVTIPEGVTSIEDFAFYGCSGLTSIVVDSSNQYYNDGNGSNCIIKTATNTLVAGCKNTVIPEDVTSIGFGAFGGCSSLTSVTIPEGVTSIEYNAFDGCSGLTSVTIPSSVTSIKDYAFYGCIGLTSVTIPEGVTSIENNAFDGCSGLTSVTIPSSVTSIEYYAFIGCSGLTSVTSNIKKPFAFGTDAFGKISSDCMLIVPAGIRDAYIAAGWTEDVFKGGVVEDVSDLLDNPDFKNGFAGWKNENGGNGEGYIGGREFFPVVENFQTAVDCRQTIQTAPGVYEISVNVFERPAMNGGYNGSEGTQTRLFMNQFSVPVQHIVKDAVTAESAVDEVNCYLGDQSGGWPFDYNVNGYGWVPNSLDGASYAFNTGRYNQTCYGIVGEDGIMNIGLTSDGNAINWCIWGNFRLTFLGKSEDALQNVVEYYARLAADIENAGIPDVEKLNSSIAKAQNATDADLMYATIFEIIDNYNAALESVKQYENAIAAYDKLEAAASDYAGTANADALSAAGELLEAYAEGGIKNYQYAGADLAPMILEMERATARLKIPNYTETPCDFTQVIENPSFETGDISGWVARTASDMRARSVTDPNFMVTNADGQYVFNTWSNPALTDGYWLSQTLFAVPAGTYKLTALFSSDQGNAITLSANGIEEEFIMENSKTLGQDGSVSFTLSEETDVEIKVVSPSWFKVDNFRLTLIESPIKKGDVNGDTRINGLDIVVIVDKILDRPITGTFVFAAADFDVNGVINGMDLVKEVALVLSQTASGAKARKAPEKFNPDMASMMRMSKTHDGSISVGIDSADDYILSQFVLELSDGQQLKDIAAADRDHVIAFQQIDGNRYMVLCYSTRNAAFTDNNDLLRISCEGEGTVKVTDVMMVDADRKPHYVRDTEFGEATGIEIVNGSFVKPADIYSVSGSLVRKNAKSTRGLGKGIYVVNGKVVNVK